MRNLPFTLYRAQGGGEPRQRPRGMPERVPPKAPAAPPKPVDALPSQKPVGDEPEVRPPARWKAIAKRALIALMALVLLAILYVFLLIGEPGEDEQLTGKQTAVVEEIIRVPMAAVEAEGGDLSTFAATFGKPMLAMYGNLLDLRKVSLFDTAFEGGYARRVTLEYLFGDGQILRVESVRPTKAATLLGGSSFHLNAQTLYTVGGIDAMRIDSADETRIIAQGTEAVYAVSCPASHASELTALLKQTTLLSPGT